MLIVAPGGETFALAYQKVDGIYVPPAAISSKTVGTDVNFTMAQVGFDARPNVWYPEPVGEVTIEATTTNIRVDLVARLNAADGDVLGRCSGVGGMLKERLTLIPVRNPGLPIRSAASMSDSRRRCSSASKSNPALRNTPCQTPPHGSAPKRCTCDRNRRLDTDVRPGQPDTR